VASQPSRGPWIHIVADGEAPPALQAMYDAMRDPRGHVDHILTIHGLHPASLRAHYDFYRAAMTGSPDLSKVRREMIAVVVSSLNRCEY
jgi:alkylhydroperoxidase family enzyme